MSMRSRLCVVFLAMSLTAIGCPDGEAGSLSLDVSTYLGGSQADFIRDVTTDSQGNSYVTGGTASPNFPTTPGAYDRTFDSSGTQAGQAGPMDVFVTKLDPSGRIVWSTLLGGPNYDRGYAVEVDSQGYVYVAGRAGPNFPVTPGAFQTSFGGGSTSNFYGPQDAFICKLTPDGSARVFCTYLGTTDDQALRDLAIDQDGNIYIARGHTLGTYPWPTTVHRLGPGGGTDAMVLKIAPDGSRVLWATYLGGSRADGDTPSIRVMRRAAQDYPYVRMGTQSSDLPTTAGAYDRTYNGNGDTYLAQLTPDGAGLIYATYLGGAQGGEFSETHGLVLDAQGNAYVAGTTMSPDFPTTAGAFQRVYAGSAGPCTGKTTNYPGDAFVAKISPTGGLLASTFIGGRYGEGTEGVGVDAQGNVYLGGATFSDNFPVTADAFQSSTRGGADLFAVKLAADFGTLLYATYLGGSYVNCVNGIDNDGDYGRTAHVDPSGAFYIAGHTKSNDWPIRQAIQGTRGGNWDGVLARFSPTSTANQAPRVNAGMDEVITRPASVTLDGTVTDDGSPHPPGRVTTTWSKIFGAGTVAFGDAAAVDTTASFSLPDTYLLRLSATDGALQAYDDMVVTVNPQPTTGQNLLADPGFENRGVGWRKVHYGGRSVVATKAHSGTKSQQMLVSTRYTREVYQDVPIRPGTPYDAAGWVKTIGVRGRAGSSISLVWLTAKGTVLRTDVLGVLLGTNNWTRLAGRYMAPANAVMARFRLFTGTNPDGRGAAWFDDHALIPARRPFRR